MCEKSRAERVKLLRDRAEEVRTMGEGVQDRVCRDQFMICAAEYDRLADLEESMVRCTLSHGSHLAG